MFAVDENEFIESLLDTIDRLKDENKKMRKTNSKLKK